VLELLSSPLLVLVSYCLSVDFSDIRESVDYEGPKEHSISHLIVFDGDRGERLKSLKF
jgi:hypothetical protein